MPSLLRMPEVAADTSEATLVSWPVAEHTPYSATDTIATVETAKAGVDIEAEADGVILKTLVPEGTDVKVGEPIAVIGAPGESVADIDAVVARLTGGASDAAGPGATGTAATAGQDAGPGPRQPGGPPPESAVSPRSSGTRTHEVPEGRVFSSPLARRLAREAGLALADINGTGPGNRVTRRDVEAAVAAREAPREAAPADRPAPVLTGRQAGDAPRTGAARPAGEANEVPHSRLRRTIAARLSESKRTVPHFYLRGTARADALVGLRAQINENAPVRVSVNDLVIKAAAVAHTLVPAMNVVWSPEALRSFDDVDISVAIASERGLVTPVVRAANSLTVSAIAATVRDYVARADEGTLGQRELEGGTLTVSNLGMFGTEEFAAIINPPQSAILAVGAVREEPVVRDGEVEVGKVMRVTLSVDHRPVDGAVAARWMRAFLALLEDPLRIVA